MIIPEIKIYEGEDLSGPTLDVMFLKGFQGTLKNIFLYLGGNVADDAVFNLTKNGISLFSGTDRIIISAAANSVSKTDLAIEINQGDVLFLDLEECGEAGVSAPITLVLQIDDGGASGAGSDGLSAYEVAVSNGFVGSESQWLDSLVGEQGETGNQGNPGTQGIQGNPGAAGSNGVGVPNGGTTAQILEKIDNADFNTRWVDKPTGGAANGYSKFDPDAPYLSPSAYDDEFDGAALDSKWTLFGTALTVKDFTILPSLLAIKANNGNLHGYFQTLAGSASNQKFRGKFLLPNSDQSAYNLDTSNDYIFTGLICQTTEASNNIYELSFYLQNYAFNGQLNKWSSDTSYIQTLVSNAISNTMNIPYVYLEIYNDNTNNKTVFSYSFNGYTFNKIYEISGVQLSKVGFYTRGSSAKKAFVDWFRKVGASGFTGRKINL